MIRQSHWKGPLRLLVFLVQAIPSPEDRVPDELGLLGHLQLVMISDKTVNLPVDTLCTQRTMC
jgi:hypothetical protein